MKKHQMKYVLTGAIILFAYIFLVMYPDAVNMPADAAETMITLFPGLFVVIVSIYGFSDSQGVGLVASMIGLGFGLCYFIDTADTLGFVSSNYTIWHIQVWIMVASTFAGGIAYAYSR